MYYDLNISSEAYIRYVRQNDINCLQLIIQAIQEGYTGIAVNFYFDRLLTDNDKSQFKPINVQAIQNFAKDKVSIEQINNFKQLSRITLQIQENRQLLQLVDSNSILQTYDLIAVKTENEKLFHTLCLDYEFYDIITFDFKKKMQFFVKKGTIEAALKKNIFFEFLYGDSFEDHDTKKIVFTNQVNLINNLKSRNIIFCSGVDNCFLHRSPFDIAALGVVLGMKPDLAQNTVGKNQLSCIQKSIYRRAYKGTIVVANDTDLKKFDDKKNKYKEKLRQKLDYQIKQQKKQDNDKMEIEKPKILSFQIDN